MEAADHVKNRLKQQSFEFLDDVRLAVIPGGWSINNWNQKLVAEFGDCVSIRRGTDHMLCVCCELEGFHDKNPLSQFISQVPHLAEVADRIHTRVDIEW